MSLPIRSHNLSLIRTQSHQAGSHQARPQQATSLHLQLTRFRLACTIAFLILALGLLLRAESGPLSAPMEVIHGKPFVSVMVNGKGPFRFVVDTGTGAEAFVTSALADELNLPSAGQIHLSDPSGKGGQKVPMVMLQSLVVAGVEFNNVKALRHPISEDDGNCQGMLGFPLFRAYLLTLDYPRRRIQLDSGSLVQEGQPSVLSFRMPDGIPIVPFEIAGAKAEPIKLEALIDSGGTGLSLPEQVATRLKFVSDPTLFGNAQSFSTRFQVKSAQLAANVHLGSYTFEHPYIEINPAFPLANFGSCPLQHFAVTFDQKNKLVRFEASKQTLHLAATPTAIRLDSAPSDKPPSAYLVPIG